MQKKINWQRLDKISAILSEVAREQRLFAKEMRQLQAAQRKTDEQIKELRNAQQKTDEQIKELRNAQRKTDEQIKLTNKEIDKTSKEIDKTNEEIDKLKTMVGDLTDGWGKFVLGLFEPSIEDCIKSLGFDIIRVDAPPKRRIKDKEYEIDLLILTQLDDKPNVLVIEVKSSINQQKIDEFINKHLKRFKEFFFEYKDIDLMGAVAGVRFMKGAKEYALNYGLYIFGTAKGMMRNLTPAGFKPKIW
jgi:chromosome segregation ATPase